MGPQGTPQSSLTVQDCSFMWGGNEAVKHWECALLGRQSSMLGCFEVHIQDTWRSSKLCPASFFICDALFANRQIVSFPKGVIRQNLRPGI